MFHRKHFDRSCVSVRQLLSVDCIWLFVVIHFSPAEDTSWDDSCSVSSFTCSSGRSSAVVGVPDNPLISWPIHAHSQHSCWFSLLKHEVLCYSGHMSCHYLVTKIVIWTHFQMHSTGFWSNQTFVIQVFSTFDKKRLVTGTYTPLLLTCNLNCPAYNTYTIIGIHFFLDQILKHKQGSGIILWHCSHHLLLILSDNREFSLEFRHYLCRGAQFINSAEIC